MLLNNKRIVPAALLTVLMLGAAGCENNPGNVSDNSAVSENTVSENVTLNLPAPVTYSGLDFSVPEGFTEAAGNTEDNKVYKGPMSVDDSYIAYRVSEKDPGDDYSIMTKEDMQRALKRMAHQISERNHGVDNVVFLGIKRRGVPLARMLVEWKMAGTM